MTPEKPSSEAQPSLQKSLRAHASIAREWGKRHLAADIDLAADALDQAEARAAELEGSLGSEMAARVNLEERARELLQEREAAWSKVRELEAERENLAARYNGAAARALELEAEREEAIAKRDENHAIYIESQVLLLKVQERRDALAEKVRELEESAAMACITPDPDCDCAGCSYAKEKHSV